MHSKYLTPRMSVANVYALFSVSCYCKNGSMYRRNVRNTGVRDLKRLYNTEHSYACTKDSIRISLIRCLSLTDVKYFAICLLQYLLYLG